MIQFFDNYFIALFHGAFGHFMRPTGVAPAKIITFTPGFWFDTFDHSCYQTTQGTR